MNAGRIIGFVLLAVGVVLLLFGLNATDALGEEVKENLTGKYSDGTMLYLVGGIAAIVLGAGLAFFGGRRIKA